MRSRLTTLIFEELSSAFAPDAQEALVAEALEAGASFDTDDAAALHALADGTLRAVLRVRLGDDAGDELADRICAALARHRDRAGSAPATGERHSIFPSVPDLDEGAREEPLSVAILQSDAGLRTTVLQGLQRRGFTVVVIGSARRLARAPAAGWVDAFVVSSTLAPIEVRELGRWVSSRERPALVVVWPAGAIAPSAREELPLAVLLPTPDLEVLAATLHRHLRSQRPAAAAS